MSRRVRICLSKIFNDYRKEAFIYVDDNFKFVSDFEKHVRKLFDIKSKIYLTIGNCLLPSSEFVNVIQSNDNIIVNKLEHQTSDGLEVSPIEDDIQEKEVDCESNDETDTTSKRGKRIRKRKRKPASGNKPETQETNSVETIQKNVIEQPLKLFKESTSKSNSHIRFSEADEPASSNSAIESTINAQARVIRPVTVLSNAEYSIGGEEGTSATQKFERDINSLKECANDSRFTKAVSKIDFDEMRKTMDNSNKFVSLEHEPKVYDVLAFKMLTIGQNYTPQLSEWIIAMVKDVEDLNVTVNILAGKDETLFPDGKFSMEICEETVDSSDTTVLKRSDMLNVKVLPND